MSKKKKNARTIQSAEKVHTEEAIKKRGEVFTPTSLVKEMLDKLPQDVLLDCTKTVGDISGCGDGQFLVEVLRRRLENRATHKEALFTIYGVDIDDDNANKCRERLLRGSTDPLLQAIVNRNIICGNPLNPKEKEYGWKHVGWMWNSAPTLEQLESLSIDQLKEFRAPTREEWREGGEFKDSLTDMKDEWKPSDVTKESVKSLKQSMFS